MTADTAIDLTLSTRFFSIAFLVTAMLAVGLEATGREIVGAMRDTRFFGRAALANLVLVPAFCWLLVQLLPLRQDLAAGLLLMSAAPGAPFAIQFTRQAKGAVPLAAALLLASFATALVVTPTLGALLLQAGVSLELPVAELAWRFALYLVAPLLVGLVVRRLAPGLASRLKTPVSWTAGLCFPFLLVLTLGLKSVRTLELGGARIALELAAMLLLVLGGMTIGWLLGGPGRDTRAVLAVGTGMRNTMVALLVASASFPESDIDLTVLTASAVGLAAATVLTSWEKLRAPKRTPDAPAPPSAPPSGDGGSTARS